MAKLSTKNTNERRKKLVKKNAGKRARLKAKLDREANPADNFQVQIALQKLPKNSNPNRVRNRCGLTGRPRAYYRKFGMSRIALRELASLGLIPGVTKSSW